MNYTDILNVINTIEKDLFSKDLMLIDILNKFKHLEIIPMNKNIKSTKTYNLNNSKLHNNKLENDLSFIVKYNNLITSIREVSLCPDFMNLDLKIKYPLFKLVYDRLDNPIILITKIHSNSVGEFNNFNVYGLYGEGIRSNNIDDVYNYIILKGTVRTSSNVLEIDTLEINKFFRQGRGSILINYLEYNLTPFFNRILKKDIDSHTPILRIEGSLGVLGLYYHLSHEDRIKFYVNNGFNIYGRGFYKTLSS